ncbi:hypothetical protein [Polynucleobacter asymbioticus]|uniref:hypothetical protein n=1 Tax=Polynucleobacter asymbioticus TaxID=576611 RepID=UPI0008F8CEDC|nr:hypothetical protein [Polynucleobacter asymbioticus]
MDYQEYKPTDFLDSLDEPTNTVEAKEYHPTDFLNDLDKPEPEVKKPIDYGQVLKGAEFFIKPFAVGAKSNVSLDDVKNLGKGAASLFDTAYNAVVPAAAAYITQPFARSFGGQSPEQSQETANKVAKRLESPIGSNLGITEDAAYKNEATHRASDYVNDKVGGLVNQGAKWLNEHFNVPIPDAEHMINSAALLATHGASKIPAKAAVGGAVDQLAQQFGKYKQELNTGVRPQPEPTPKGFADAGFQTNGGPGENMPAPKASAPPVIESPKVIESQPVNRAETKPYTPDEIESRKELLTKVGLDQSDHRLSALQGNPKEAASQYITSQADQGPYGSSVTEQINKEKSALDTHFDKIAQEAGGTQVRYNDPVFQEADKIKVGTTIKDALQESYEGHKAKTSELYKEAGEQLGDKPVNLDNFNNFLNADENFAYQNEKGLQSGVKQFVKRSGYIDEAGNVKPLTVAQAEDVRQYINSKYHHETKQLGGQLKGLLDSDVFENVGGQTYEKARKHYMAGKEIYDNPKAMGDLLADNGVNEKIPAEKVLSKVSALPNKQFEHLFTTLKENGKSGAADQIKTSLVEQIKRAGSSAKDQPFNSVAASKEAANLSEKLRIAFADDPKALQSIYDGIAAADILHIPTKYSGAGVQTHLLKNKLTEAGIHMAATRAGEAIGGYFGGPAGAMLGGQGGSVIGSKGASALKSNRQAKQFNKEMDRTNLSDMRDKYAIKE